MWIKKLRHSKGIRRGSHPARRLSNKTWYLIFGLPSFATTLRLPLQPKTTNLNEP